MDEIKAKQQVIEKIKEASKILVTVSDSPSVDALSAALGLTMILDKQGKHATAIFSGETPPAIAFLEPEKTFDDTTDSLRDFIIALNKEKADHLRYKVEGDSVKIFITPYKTVIGQDDLEFSQGDYNIELVIALGVDNQDHLDAALENHGKILHDASIITVTAGDQTSDLGGVDWHDANASSLSEMVAGVAEALKEDKKSSLVDETIATALLTGIVAQTDRFSNEHTTSKAMTVSATLMASGADQQLIANELQAAQNAAPSVPEEKADTSDGKLSIKNTEPATESSDSLAISHEGETLADLDRRIRGKDTPEEKVEEAPQEQAKEVAQEETNKEVEVIKQEVALNEPEPTLGGTLNATTEQAADDARREEENDQNKTILSHSYLGESDPMNAGAVGVNAAPSSDGELHSVYAPKEEPAVDPQPPVNPTPADLGLPLPPPIPDFSQVNGAPTPQPPALPLQPAPQPAILGDILAPDTTNTIPAPNSAYAFEPEPVAEQPASAQPAPVQPLAPQPVPQPEQLQQPAQPAQPPAAADPGQFQIPPQ